MRKIVWVLLGLGLFVFQTSYSFNWIKRLWHKRITQKNEERKWKATHILFESVICNDKEGIEFAIQKGAYTTGGYIDGIQIERLLADESLRIKTFQPLEYGKKKSATPDYDDIFKELFS